MKVSGFLEIIKIVCSHSSVEFRSLMTGINFLNETEIFQNITDVWYNNNNNNITFIKRIMQEPLSAYRNLKVERKDTNHKTITNNTMEKYNITNMSIQTNEFSTEL